MKHGDRKGKLRSDDGSRKGCESGKRRDWGIYNKVINAKLTMMGARKRNIAACYILPKTRAWRGGEDQRMVDVTAYYLQRLTGEGDNIIYSGAGIQL